MKRLLLSLALLAPAIASAQPAARFSLLGLPAALTKPRLQGLLQGFVAQQYGKSFRELGVERDFDHGHLLFDRAGRPVAVLYHTMEDSAAAAKTPRSWLQWLESGRVEEAARYARRAYPRTAAWDLFVALRLPELRRRGTVTDEMLDPARIDVDPRLTRQWTFERVPCRPEAQDSSVIQEDLPAGPSVCLSLGVD